MRRSFAVLTASGLYLALCGAAQAEPLQAEGHYAAARDEWLAHGGSEESSSAALQVGGGPLVWDNGGSNNVNGLSSERDTSISGTGGPEGNHASTVADDFEIVTPTVVSEIRVCLYHDGTTAEMYIYRDDNGFPAMPVTAPLWGGPSTADIVSTTFVDNTQRCQSAFGYPGRQYIFSVATTGVAITLEPGRYWLAVVGQGGTRAFWTDSTPPIVLNTGKWGSTFFGFPYWSETSAQGQPSFAFEIRGADQTNPAPVVGPRGLVVAALILFVYGLIVARRRRWS